MSPVCIESPVEVANGSRSGLCQLYDSTPTAAAEVHRVLYDLIPDTLLE